MYSWKKVNFFATRGSVEGAKIANSHAGLAVETGSHCC